ncbi:Fic family protein [Flavobacterium zepuense]|uniref:Fic family protein n=1 Tax=Flavobacterium zepuense TaxID=2593302 RepID=A0A552UWH7_9FLAO|nr:Fic family protein [Flavobacterium zepuense]TRW22558.1 Fic family protein [Flavobacterium zepuense]
MLGKRIKQSEGYFSFIPEPFPPKELTEFSSEIITKAALAERLIGKLDGITHILPNADFFLNMYVIKDATNSAQIEGTRATMMDALEMKAGINVNDTDADDILFYIKALHYGIARLKEFPFSLRFIKELHKELMIKARSTHFADPGEFRNSQNWIGGTTLQNAMYVPPPVNEMKKALADFEKYIHNDNVMPVLQAGILHAQFETIHPFLDGNGRTGRLIITLFLYERAILEKPVLFLSSFFKKNQQLYYDKLNAYHNNRPEEWLHFFLDGVIQTAKQSIETSSKITILREEDMRKLQALGKREATSGVEFLQLLFRDPIVTNSIAANSMEFSRAGAAKLIERFIELDILTPLDENDKYGKVYIYRKYLDIFNN